MNKILLSFLLVFTGLTAFSQKIPFQGKLTQDDEPFSGTVTLKFSIPDVSWSETHEGVGVLDGFYSVVLGENTPFPDSLFAGVDEHQLSISVDGTALSTVTLYKPLQSSSFTDHFDGSQDHPALKVKRTGVAGSGFAALEAVSEMDGDSYALYGQSTGKGKNFGVYGYARGAGRTNWAMFGLARGEGDGTEGYGTGSYNDGVVGYARDNAWGNTGVYGRAYGGAGVDNNGVVGWAEVNNGSDTIVNSGVLGWAKGPGTNYGIRGIADGGINNWAGWFEGDVNVNGQLMVNGEPISGGGAAGNLEVRNPDGALKGELKYFEPNDAGNLVLYGANDSIKTALGSSFRGYGGSLNLFDSLGHPGARIFVNPKGVGNLYTYDVNHNVSGWFGNQGNRGGFMQLAGYHPETGAFTGATFTGMSSWNNGLPYFVMEGSSVDPFIKLLEFGGMHDGRSEKPYFHLNSSSRALNGIGSALSMGVSHQDLPFIELKGGNDRNWDMRAQLRVDSINSLGTAGRIELLGPLGNENNDVRSIFSVGAANDPGGADPSGASGEMFLWGSSTPNFQLGGKPWENGDHSSFQMFGSYSNGQGWFNSNISMNVHNTVNYEAGSLHMVNTQEGGATNETVYMSSNLHDGDAGGIVLRDFNNNTTIQLIGGRGEISAVTVTQTSDERLKANIKTQKNALQKVKQLRGVTFEWERDENNAPHIGFIAQEIEKVYPEVVHTKDDGYKAVNYAVLVSSLVEAIKELDAKVAELEAENKDLKAAIESDQSERLAQLQSEIDEIKKLLGVTVQGVSGASK